MKIKLIPAAAALLELIGDTRTNKTGFVIGQDIGKFRIIENLLPVNFDETTINEVYAKAYNKIGDKLIGVFFNHNETKNISFAFSEGFELGSSWFYDYGVN